MAERGALYWAKLSCVVVVVVLVWVPGKRWQLLTAQRLLSLVDTVQPMEPEKSAFKPQIALVSSVAMGKLPTLSSCKIKPTV